MIKHSQIWGFNITWKFRHRWEPVTNWIERYQHHRMWNNWKFGLSCKKDEIFATKEFHTSGEWENDVVPQYILKADLLVCKAELSIDRSNVN